MGSLTALADWAPFFGAQLGASATLAGLLFVGISLNLNKILAGPFLPLRALLALGLLIGILVVASLMLIPGQSRPMLATEVLLVGGFAWLGGSLVEGIGWRRLGPGQSRLIHISNTVLLQAATIPYLVAGAWLLAGNDNGLYWVAAAVILSTIKAVVDAWVLLVEINR